LQTQAEALAEPFAEVNISIVGNASPFSTIFEFYDYGAGKKVLTNLKR